MWRIGQPAILVNLSKSDDLAYGPQLLPDNDTLLFSIMKRADAAIGQWEATQVVIQSIKTGVRKTLIDGGSEPQYVPTGHIVYGSQGTLFAVPFDLKTLTVTGDIVPMVEGVRRGATFGLGVPPSSRFPVLGRWFLFLVRSRPSIRI